MNADARILVLRNHGVLTVGETIGEAFFWMYRMEMACQYQVDILSMGQKLKLPDKKVQEETINLAAKLFGKNGFASKNMQWPAMIRKVDQDISTDWRN